MFRGLPVYLHTTRTTRTLTHTRTHKCHGSEPLTDSESCVYVGRGGDRVLFILPASVCLIVNTWHSLFYLTVKREVRVRVTYWFFNCVTQSLSGSGGWGYLSRSTGHMHVTHVYTHTTQCCLLYTSPSPRDRHRSRMPSSA